MVLDIKQLVGVSTMLKSRKCFVLWVSANFKLQYNNPNEKNRSCPSVKVKFSKTISGGYTANKKVPINPAAGFNK